MDLVEVICKSPKNKKVPVLDTPQAKKGMLCLIKHRKSDQSKYMFATVSYYTLIALFETVTEIFF